MQNLMPPIDTTDHAFHDGDPTTGQLGTIVTAAWLNDVQGATRDIQAEIIAVLTKAGIQPNPQKQNQLAEAISQIIGSGGYATSGDLTLGLSKKIDKADIAQQLGNDTTKVPSLHLVTTELGKKASVADANSKLAKDQNGADIPNKPKFIENLGLGEAAKSGVVQTTGSSKINVMSQDGSTKAFMQVGAHGLGVRSVGDANVPKDNSGAGFYTVGNSGFRDIPPNTILIRMQGEADRFIGCSTDGKGKIFFKDHALNQLLYLYHEANKPPSFGIGYKHKNEKSNRKNDTLYTNSSDETIWVSVSSTTTDVNGVLTATMYVDGENISRMAIGGGGSISVTKAVSVSGPVGPGQTVRVRVENGEIGYWTEFKKS